MKVSPAAQERISACTASTSAEISESLIGRIFAA